VYVILITGYGGANNAVEALGCGADEFLTKPLDPLEMIARVRSIQRLKALHDEVRGQNDRLKTIQRFKDDWVNMVVHDLRSPMSAISGYAEMAATKASPLLENWLSIVQRETMRVNRMLEQMLVIAKSEDGALELSRSSTDLRELVTSACQAASPQAKAKGIRLVVCSKPGELVAEIDRSLIRRVLDNLLGNALRFGPPGSTVVVEMKRDEEGIGVAVADSGPGVPPEARYRIFDRYATVHDRSSGKSRHGLGLAYCHAVVAAHGGHIECLSNQPSGTRIEVRLPVTIGRTSRPGSLLDSVVAPPPELCDAIANPDVLPVDFDEAAVASLVEAKIVLEHSKDGALPNCFH
jgi:signal transduction histidine kinase